MSCNKFSTGVGVKNSPKVDHRVSLDATVQRSKPYE